MPWRAFRLVKLDTLPVRLSSIGSVTFCTFSTHNKTKKEGTTKTECENIGGKHRPNKKIHSWEMCRDQWLLSNEGGTRSSDHKRNQPSRRKERARKGKGEKQSSNQAFMPPSQAKPIGKAIPGHTKGGKESTTKEATNEHAEQREREWKTNK